MRTCQKNIYDLNKSSTNVLSHETLLTLFEEQLENNLNQTALIFKNEKYSYFDLNAKANQIAHYLLGISHDNLMVALCMKPSFDLLIAMLGILKAGHAYVPLDPDNPISRLRFILEDTKSKIILTQSSEIALFTGIDAQLLCLDKQQSMLEHYPKSNPAHRSKTDDLAYVIYTSGSTGEPKGVMITHSNVIHFIHWFSQALSITNEDIFDFSSSISFDFAVATTLFPMMQGAKISICPEQIKKDPYLYARYLSETQVSIIKTTPGHFRNLKEALLNQKINLPLKYVVFGGNSLFVTDIKDWLNQFPEHILFCEYGPTEATVATSWLTVDKYNVNHFKNKIPIGKPALNTQLYILDEQLQPLPPGETGELYIGGRGVAKGYLNRKELTEKKFIRNPFSKNSNERLYQTGDYCRFLEDGNIEFIERLDNQVKIRGYRVQMEEIEACLITHPDIKAVVVSARHIHEDNIAEKQLVAYCVPKNENKLDLFELRHYLKKQVPEYMIPAIFEVLEILPLSSNGKIDRHQLPEPKSIVNGQDTIPGSELERLLKTIWEEVLHLKHINSNDNFFNLGGNSLAAARIITKIRQKLNKEISLHNFYSSLTIGSLAQLIKKTGANDEPLKIKHTKLLPESGVIPLNELQFLFWLMRLFYPQAKICNIIDRKRFAGILEPSILNRALEYVCSNHQILRYFISHYSPVQYLQQLPSPKVEEIDLSALSLKQQELELSRSLDTLQHLSWKKDKYLFVVRLFCLGSDQSELQIGISHFISDKISSGVFFRNLSEYYLACLNQKKIVINQYRSQYKDYVEQDIFEVKNNLQKNSVFWEAYLKGVPSLYFPEQYLVQDSEPLNTSITKIPQVILEHLQSFCSAQCLSITDSLIAAVSVSLTPYLNKNKKNKTLIINLVKSTRDSDEYDEAIGLFIRTDLVKIDLNSSADFLELSKKAQKSIMETAAYQSCPIVIKLGYLLKSKWEKNKFFNKLSTVFSKSYASIFPKYKLDYRVLRMFLRIFSTRKSNRFFVDVNIMNHFMAKNTETKLFALDLKNVEPFQGDRTVDKNILNIWFDQDSEDKVNLILSGNLKNSFLDQIANDMIKTLHQNVNKF